MIRLISLIRRAVVVAVVSVAMSINACSIAADIGEPQTAPATRPAATQSATQAAVPTPQNPPPPVVVNVKVANDKDILDKFNIYAAIANAAFAFLAAAGSLAAAFLAWRAAVQANQATKQANDAAKQAEQTDRNERLVTLFDDCQKATFLDDKEIRALDKTTEGKVLANLNIMEKIAFCWERNLVDRTAIAEEVKPFYEDLYEQIKGLPVIPSLERDGAALIDENKRATRFYVHLKSQK